MKELPEFPLEKFEFPSTTTPIKRLNLSAAQLRTNPAEQISFFEFEICLEFEHQFL